MAVGARLELVGPLGFDMSSARLKRAGLDYWPFLNWKLYSSWGEWNRENPQSVAGKVWLFSTKGKRSLYDSPFQPGDALVFGRETAGLGEEILNERREQTVVIPMPGPVRSLNLSNAVAVALYTALRQTGGSVFSGSATLTGEAGRTE